jgi:hypothetical protein
VFDKNSANYLPALAFALEWFKIGEYEVVLPAFLLEFDISLEDLGVLILDLVVVVDDFLWNRHPIFI